MSSTSLSANVQTSDHDVAECTDTSTAIPSITNDKPGIIEETPTIQPLNVRRKDSIAETYNEISLCSDDTTLLGPTLPSFSVPSSATKLFSAFPSDDAGLSLESECTTFDQKAVDSSGPSILASPDKYLAFQTPRFTFSPLRSPFTAPLSPSVSSLSSCNSILGGHDLGRESLTPRFNHLRAVLEGRFEDPPPLPTVKDHRRHNNACISVHRTTIGIISK